MKQGNSLFKQAVSLFSVSQLRPNAQAFASTQQHGTGAGSRASRMGGDGRTC